MGKQNENLVHTVFLHFTLYKKNILYETTRYRIFFKIKIYIKEKLYGEKKRLYATAILQTFTNLYRTSAKVSAVSVTYYVN